MCRCVGDPEKCQVGGAAFLGVSFFNAVCMLFRCVLDGERWVGGYEGGWWRKSHPGPPAKDAFCRLLPSYEIAIFGPGRPLAGPGKNTRVGRDFFGAVTFPRGGRGIFESVVPSGGFYLCAHACRNLLTRGLQ